MNVKGLSIVLNTKGNKIFNNLKKKKISNDRAITKLERLIYSGDPTYGTLSVRYSLFKKKFRELGIDKDFLDEFRPPEKLTYQVLKDNKEIRDNRKLFPVSMFQVEKIIDLKESDHLIDLALYLLLVSGRRTNELINAKFFRGKHKKHIKIIGLSKSKINSCEFPILISRQRFMKLINYFQNLDVNKNTFSVLLNRRIKKLLGQKWTAHKLRKVYAKYLYKYNNPDNMKINSFIKNVLCHSTIESSLNYTDVKLNDFRKMKF